MIKQQNTDAFCKMLPRGIQVVCAEKSALFKYILKIVDVQQHDRLFYFSVKKYYRNMYIHHYAIYRIISFF